VDIGKKPLESKLVISSSKRLPESMAV